MKKVIIAEKPSLAKSIVSAIGGNFDVRNGYYENGDYVVSYAFGHLFTLYSIADYLGEEKTKWELSYLPFTPSEFKFKLKDDDGVKKQFKVIKELVNRDDVDTIINCGDADREGEVIINLIIKNALKSKKSIKRLWLPEQTKETIREGLNNLKDSSNYENLLNEGLLRTYVDWLYGINLTQLVTLKKGDLFSVGRVVIPIVEVIYSRDKEIENFVPKKYYQPDVEIEKDGKTIKLSISEKFDGKAECEKEVANLKDEKLIVEKIEVKEVRKYPKKLFSLDKLQNALSKKYKLNANESLSIVQKLYEKGYVTYPRTNTEYLSEEEKDKIRKLVSLYTDDECKLEFKDSKSIFDSSKIESHSAITPTSVKPTDLRDIDLNVYDVIKNRFLANFTSEECKIEETKVIFRLGEYRLSMKGSVVKQLGYLKYENDLNEKLLPKFELNEEVEFEILASEKLTQPPKHISLEELNNYLKNPFKNDEMTEDEEYKLLLSGVEIGTVATRGAIIEKAVNLGYLLEKKGTYYIAPKGIELIETLNKLGIDMYKDKTVELSKKLKQVYKGETNKENALKYYEKDLSLTVNKAKEIEVTKSQTKKDEREVIGKCPKCGKNVYESAKNFYCEGFKDNPKCDFSLFKNNKFFEVRGKKLNKTIVKALLKDGQAKVTFKKKAGGTYNAIVKMEVDDRVNFSLEFTK